MNKGKQATLFQSWGQKKETTQSSIIDLCDGLDEDDDELLAEAMERSLHEFIEEGHHTENNNQNDPDICNISIGAHGFPSSTQSLTQKNIPTGFDKVAGKLWIYPTNYPVRDYQFSIVDQALHKNTMVTLPTGLGKTFIAAVVMYNFYRWYPQGKVVFMAPTKPLVAQQIEACYNIMAIPQEDTAEMTGTMAPTERKKVWTEKRVFFLTPQVIMNDLSRGTCPAVDVRCLVIDEAHKATGNHAYCQVVRELIKYTTEFRILALSATPGGDIKAVQQVLANLLISHIELRTEDSPDIKPYSHERKVEKIVVPLGDELTKVKAKYVQIMDVTVNRLKRHGVIYRRETTSLSKFLILKAREDFRQNPPPTLQRNNYGAVEGDFALALSLYHGYELLQLHGSRSLYNFLDGILHGDKAYGRTRAELTRNPEFNDLMDILREKFAPADCRPSQSGKNPLVTGHPKIEKLEKIVLDHFKTFDKGDGETRVMIFSQYRDSVTEITNILKQHHPIVKVMSFIGQSSAGKATKGFTQKEQLKVMKDFREGGYNTLVSTCVGEEGLDIGDVDLIICFDAHKSPIRLVQRMGRTGRKREGRIVMLVTEGKEEQIYNQSQYSKKSVHKAILNGANTLHFYQNNPAMIPDDWIPKCHKMFITVSKKFKPSKAVTSVHQNKITNMLTSNDKKGNGDGGISRQEFEELKQFTAGELHGKTLPQTSSMLCLGENKQMKTENNLSLSDWLPWQNRLQQTFKVDHSKQTKHFVELVEFLELQEALDPNEDNYGQEMEVFLNESDILKPGQTDEDCANIKQFFVANDNNSKIGKKKRSLLNTNKIRRSDQLPEIEAFVLSGESDEDLPAVFDKKCERKETYVTERKDDEISIIHENLSYKDESEKNVKNEKKYRTKNRKFSGNTSVVEIIADTDVNDFVDSVDELPIIKEESQEQDKCDVVMETEVLHTNTLESKSENGGHVDLHYLDVNQKYNMDTDSELKDDCHDFTKLLPTFFAEPSDFITSLQENNNTNDSVCFIPEAPSLDELEMLVKDISHMTTLPKIDLHQLINEWEKEKSSNINLTDSRSTNARTLCDLSSNLVIDNKFQNLQGWSLGRPVKKNIESPMKHSSNSPNGIGLQTEKTVLNVSNDLNSPGRHGKETDIDIVNDKDETKHLDERNEKLIIQGNEQCCDISAEGQSDNDNKVIQQLDMSVSNEFNHNENEMQVDAFSGSDEGFMDSQANFMLTYDDLLADLNSDESNEDSQKKQNDSEYNTHKDEIIHNDKNDSNEFIFEKSVSNSKTINPCKSGDVSLFNDSFMNASVLEAVQTPALEYKLSSPQLHDRNPSPSQFTFTQALACVHDSDSMDRLLEAPREANMLDIKAISHKTVDRSPENPSEVNPVGVQAISHNNRDRPLGGESLEEPTMIQTRVEPGKVNPSSYIHSMENISPKEKKPENNVVTDRTEHRTTIKAKSTNGDKTLLKDNRDMSSDIDNFTVMIGPIKDAMEMSQLNVINYFVNMDNTDDFSEDEQATELPKFDLGFNVDDDVIPPSPCLSQTLSQKTNLKNLSQSVLSSRKSLSFLCDTTKSKSFEDKNKTMIKPALPPTVEETESNKTRLEEDLDLGSQVFDTQMDTLCRDIDNDLENTEFTTVGNIDKTVKHGQNTIENSTSIQSNSFQCNIDDDFEMMPASPALSGKKKYSQKPGTSEEKLKTPIASQLRTSISNWLDQESPSLDDSFVVRKKRRKAVIIDSPSSPACFNNGDLDDFKTPLRPVISKNKSKFSSSSSEDGSIFKSKSRKSVSFLINEMNNDLDDEFEDELLGAQKESNVYHQYKKETKKSEYEKRKQTQSTKKKSKSPSNPFLVDEAEVSEDEVVSTDEEEGSDLDHMDDSFVSESCTQLSQGQHEELQAIYMKSVHSPTGQTGKFKLKYDYDSNIDVYSQIPQEEESQYYEDSFVVDEVEENTLLDGHEITILDRDNIIDNESFVGPRTRWSKPRKPIKMASFIQKNKRRRVKRISDSSSEEEFNPERNTNVSAMVSPSNPISTSTGTNLRNRQQIISSSDDEHDSSVMCSLKTRVTNKQNSLSFESNKLNSTSNSNFKAFCLKEKEERIQRQKSQQEEFKRKMASKQENTDFLNRDIGNEDVSEFSKNDGSCFSDTFQFSDDNDLLLNTKKSDIKPVVIVDSREINGAQDIVSELRFKHKLNVIAAQLDSCDYVVSIRMGVDRKQWTEFSNGSNRSKLIERVQEMCNFYEKPCLIIEKDKNKGEEKNKVLHWTKYVDKVLVQLLQSKVTLFFTENQSETASVLSDLCLLENRKNCAISCQTNLNNEQQNKMNFFRSIPNLSYVHCLFLCSNCVNVGKFLCSDIQMLRKNGKMTEERASGVYSYVRRMFDTQMLPSNYG